MTDTPALLPPDPDRPGRYWLKRIGPNVVDSSDELWAWSPSDFLWRHDQWHPMDAELAGHTGYTFATDPPHPIPGPAALERLYALAAPPTGPATPASPFAVGYVAGMGYLADKLRAALEDRE